MSQLSIFQRLFISSGVLSSSAYYLCFARFSTFNTGMYYESHRTVESHKKFRISTTPTNVYDRAYIALHVYNSNFEQPIRFLVTITIKRRLAV